MLFQTTLEAISEDVVAHLESKNPSIRAETAAFIARCFTKATAATLPKKLLKMFVTPLMKVSAKTTTQSANLMHQSIESPGGGGGGGGGDSEPTFCTILHSPRPPRHIFLSLIPAPRGTFFKGALKAHIHISLYENNTLQKLLFLSVIT